MNHTELDQSGTAGVESSSGTVAANQLLVTLFDGAQQKVAQARLAIEIRDTRLKGELLGSAIATIDGIRSGLDFETGGERAFTLALLYDHMERLLVEANVLSDPMLLDEVSSLLGELKSDAPGMLLNTRPL